MQDGVPQFVREGETTQGGREVATEPDQAFPRFEKAIGAAWVAIGVKCRDVETEPRGYLVNGGAVADPARVSQPVRVQELTGGLARLLRLVSHALVHEAYNLPGRIKQLFSHSIMPGCEYIHIFPNVPCLI